MDLGIVVMIGSDGLTPQAVGRACEERGFESLFWAEHTHIPAFGFGGWPCGQGCAGVARKKDNM